MEIIYFTPLYRGCVRAYLERARLNLRPSCCCCCCLLQRPRYLARPSGQRLQAEMKQYSILNAGSHYTKSGDKNLSDDAEALFGALFRGRCVCVILLRSDADSVGIRCSVVRAYVCGFLWATGFLVLARAPILRQKKITSLFLCLKSKFVRKSNKRHIDLCDLRGENTYQDDSFYLCWSRIKQISSINPSDHRPVAYLNSMTLISLQSVCTNIIIISYSGYRSTRVLIADPVC